MAIIKNLAQRLEGPGPLSGSPWERGVEIGVVGCAMGGIEEPPLWERRLEIGALGCAMGGIEKPPLCVASISSRPIRSWT